MKKVKPSKPAAGKKSEKPRVAGSPIKGHTKSSTKARPDAKRVASLQASVATRPSSKAGAAARAAASKPRQKPERPNTKPVASFSEPVLPPIPPILLAHESELPDDWHSKSPEEGAVSSQASITPLGSQPSMTLAVPLFENEQPAQDQLKEPPILSEGLLGNLSEVKHSLASTPPETPVAQATLAEQAAVEVLLPGSHGSRALWLSARDTRCIHASWDFSPEQRSLIQAESLGASWRIRVHRSSTRSPLVSEINLESESSEQFVEVPDAGSEYFVSLGYEDIFGAWVELACGRCATPPAEVREPQVAEVQFVSLALPESPLPDFHGLENFKPIPVSPPKTQWTTNSAVLDSLIPSPVIHQGQAAPALTSATPDLTQTVHAHSALLPIQGTVGSGGNLAGPDSGPSANRSDATSPAGKPRDSVSERASERPFWMQVNAEVVIYGATEPDAFVCLAGRPVSLRPDGSFTFRFSLPDDEHSVPISAMSASGEHYRWVELKIRRESAHIGTVGIHPQDPNLRSPG